MRYGESYVLTFQAAVKLGNDAAAAHGVAEAASLILVVTAPGALLKVNECYSHRLRWVVYVHCQWVVKHLHPECYF